MEVLTQLGIKPTVLMIQLVGFLLLFFVLAKFLWKPVLGLIEAREKEVEDMMSKADEARRKVELLEAEYKTRLAQIDEEAQRYRAEEIHKGHELAESIVREAREGADLEKQKALNAITEEARRARKELRDLSVSLSMEIATKVLMRNIDQKSNEDLAKTFLDELDPASMTEQ
jgi:F-type H+-transporting ATPase subunit b